MAEKNWDQEIACSDSSVAGVWDSAIYTAGAQESPDLVLEPGYYRITLSGTRTVTPAGADMHVVTYLDAAKTKRREIQMVTRAGSVDDEVLWSDGGDTTYHPIRDGVQAAFIGAGGLRLEIGAGASAGQIDNVVLSAKRI